MSYTYDRLWFPKANLHASGSRFKKTGASCAGDSSFKEFIQFFTVYVLPRELGETTTTMFLWIIWRRFQMNWKIRKKTTFGQQQFDAMKLKIERSVYIVHTV